jgi:hypothetical protein
MSYVDGIVKVFGGARALAREIGYPPTTVQSWKDRGSIPDDRKPIVLRRARELDLPLTPADFFPHDVGREEAAA